MVTTVGESHLEKLGSLAGVVEEKMALLRGLPPSGHAFVSDDPPELARAARSAFAKVRVAGWSEGADPGLRAGEVEPDEKGCFRFRWRGEAVTLRIPGRHMVRNALLALALAELLEVPVAEAARGVGEVEPQAMRGEVRRAGSLTLIVDCYNANPQSVRAAADLLATYPLPGRRVAILGSMLELGEATRIIHRRLLREILSLPLNLVVATGAFVEAANSVGSLPPSGPELLAAESVDEAHHLLRDRLAGGDVILLKASRGVALERLVPLLERDFGPGDRAGRGRGED